MDIFFHETAYSVTQASTLDFCENHLQAFVFICSGGGMFPVLLSIGLGYIDFVYFYQPHFPIVPLFTYGVLVLQAYADKTPCGSMVHNQNRNGYGENISICWGRTNCFDAARTMVGFCESFYRLKTMVFWSFA